MPRLTVGALTLLALALSLSLAPAARAGVITYSYSGSFSGPPPPASSLTGSFQVDQAAIADGAITLADIQNVSFTLAVAGFPDRSLTSFESIAGGQIAVDAQGLPTSQNALSFMTPRDPYGSVGFLTAGVNFNFLGA